MGSLLSAQDARVMAAIEHRVHERMDAAREYLTTAHDQLVDLSDVGAEGWQLVPASEADIAAAICYLSATTPTGVPEGGAR